MQRITLETQDMQKSHIIFLNGASSSGKTTLGRTLQPMLDQPYFYFSSDQLVAANILPEVDRTLHTGQRAWRTIRPRFFAGFHRCIAALATAGNSLIVEHVLEVQSWLDDCVQLLAPFDVFFVGVHCSLEELERRERERGDRTLGEGRSHLVEGVHTWGVYDFEVDTSVASPQENAILLKAALANRPKPSAFERMYVKQFGCDGDSYDDQID
jgi:chloramphenicol 3-O phosphotransferase